MSRCDTLKVTTTKRAALYCRISRDKAGGGLGVARQERDCRDLAERLGAEITAVHTDNDLSAYSGKPRPGYRKLLEKVRTGAVDVVICWHTDRLHRSPVELEEWITAAEMHGVSVHGVKAGKVDLATASGRAIARTLGAWARYESEHRAERVRSQKAEAVRDGKWRGGRRPFGYEADGVTVREAEAEIVRDLTDRALAGESIHSLSRDLNTRGVTTSTGGTWKPPEVRRLILRGRNAGFIERSHHNGAQTEILGPASWPAIVDEARWRSARRLLTAPGRRQARSADEVWIGSGIYVCGRCGDLMRSGGTPGRRDGQRVTLPAYRCRSGSHLTRVAGPLDEFVTDVVLERLSRPDARLLLAPQSRRVDLEKLHAERAELEGGLADLARMVMRRKITEQQADAATDEARAEIERIDGQIATAGEVSALSGIADAADVRAAWEAAPVSRRKAVVRALMTVTLLPAPKGRPAGWSPGSGGYFDSRAVAIEWTVGS